MNTTAHILLRGPQRASEGRILLSMRVARIKRGESAAPPKARPFPSHVDGSFCARKDGAERRLTAVSLNSTRGPRPPDIRKATLSPKRGRACGRGSKFTFSPRICNRFLSSLLSPFPVSVSHSDFVVPCYLSGRKETFWQSSSPDAQSSPTACVVSPFDGPMAIGGSHIYTSLSFFARVVSSRRALPPRIR